MSSKRNPFWVEVNDVFDELVTENKRLLNELLFANKCLTQLKAYLNKINDKYKEVIESEDKQEFSKLIIECNSGLNRDGIEVKEELNEVIVKKSEKVIEFKKNKNLCEKRDKSLVQNEREREGRIETIDSNARRSRRTDRKYYGIRVKRDTNDSIECDIDFTEINRELNELNERIIEMRSKAKTECITEIYKEISREGKAVREKCFDSKTNAYKCPKTDCKKWFTNSSQLCNHLVKSHDMTPINESPPEESLPDPQLAPNSLLLLRRNNFDPKTKSYVCPNPYCGKGFKSRRRLYHHFRITHNLSKRHFCHHLNCGKGFKTRNELNHHFRAHNDLKPFVCSYSECDFRGKTKHSLTAHSLKHSIERHYKCDECDQTFKSKYSLNAHKKRHSSQPAHRCRVEGCYQSFWSVFALNKHKVLAHNKVRRIYRCDWPGCDFTVCRSDAYANHKTLHTQERRHVCDWPECGMRFRLRQTLTDHKRVHTNDRPYACHWPGCQYRAIINANIKKHLKVHEK